LSGNSVAPAPAPGPAPLPPPPWAPAPPAQRPKLPPLASNAVRPPPLPAPLPCEIIASARQQQQQPLMPPFGSSGIRAATQPAALPAPSSAGNRPSILVRHPVTGQLLQTPAPGQPLQRRSSFQRVAAFASSLAPSSKKGNDSWFDQARVDVGVGAGDQSEKEKRRWFSNYK
jgi:hypothetical protein